MQKALLFLLYFTYLNISIAYAQIDNSPIGGRAIGLANAAVTLRDPFSIFNNVAGISTLERVHAFIAYDNRFNITPFQTFGLGLVAPVKWGVAGLTVSRFGDDLYNEQKIGLGYAYEIERVSLGIKLNYVQVNIQDLNSRGTLVLEFGGVVQLTDQIFFAAHGYNLNQAELKSDFEESEKVPTILKAGLAYLPIEELLVSVETEKDIDFPASFKAGVEYQVIDNVFLRTGIQTEPFINHFGIGFHPKTLRFDYALSTESDLGLSHHVSLAYQFGKN